MAHSQSVDAITGNFPSRNPPKQPGKPIYGSIQDTHCLLTANAALIESPLGGGQNDHLRIVLPTTQYSLVSRVPFVRPTNHGRTPDIPAWTTPSYEKAFLCEHAEQRQQYDEFHNVDATLQNQLLTEFEGRYPPPLERFHRILLSHDTGPPQPPISTIRDDIGNRTSRGRQEDPGNLQSRKSPQKPLHEAEQVRRLRNRGGRAYHRGARRPHRLRPCPGNRAILVRLPNLASQVRAGKDLDNVRGKFHRSAGRPAVTSENLPSRGVPHQHRKQHHGNVHSV